MSFAIEAALPVATDAPPAYAGPPKGEHATKMQALLSDTESFLREIQVPKAGNMSFEVNGIPFNAQYTPAGKDSKVIIWATLGYLPYSVTDQSKRKALIRILESAHFLHTAKMGIDRNMRILVKGIYPVCPPLAPDYFFQPLLKLIQETRPFLRLIGENL